MKEFNFGVAGKITFGWGVSMNAGDVAASWGCRRALLVTDDNLMELGHADRIAECVRAAGVDTNIFYEVEPEPSVETTDKAAQIAREMNADLVVGLGGGSCLDVAKAVSVLVTNEGSAADYQGLGLVKKPGVRKLMIPTTSGTGSEVTFTSVLIRRSDGVKGGINSDFLFADASLLDPDLTMSLPPVPTAATGMDAFTHAVEAYTSKQASPVSDIFAEKAMSLISKSIRKAVLAGDDRDARYNMLLGSLMGGVALANAGVGACHALAYPLGGMFGVGHGMANALLIPYVMRFNCLAAAEKYSKVAEIMGYNVTGIPMREAAMTATMAVEELVSDICLPMTLNDLDVGITEEHFPEMAEKAMKIARPIANNPRVITDEDCIAIYCEALGFPIED